MNNIGYTIDSIDEEKTILNGRNICEQYKPLVEKRIKQILITPMNSTSVVSFSGGNKSRNSFENKLIERCAWNDDQVTKFIDNILSLEKSDPDSGTYLKYKYLYDKTDEEIAKELKVARRTVLYRKKKAYYQIAIWSNKVEYQYCETFHFVIF